MMHWMLISPELYYLTAAFWLLVACMTGPPKPKRDYFTALSLSAVGVIISLASVTLQGILFSQTYRIDLFAQVFKVMLASGLFLVVCICTELNGIRERYQRELYLLLFVCTLAMMMLVSSVHLLNIYISLELSSYSLYILVALRKQRDMGLEAGIKYFLIGIFASALMLFGIAMLYGATRVSHIEDLIQVLPGLVDNPAVIIGLLLTLSGFFFKLAVFPFHLWAPDVYQGASNQVTAYIATASKVAAIAILLRLIALTGDGSVYLVHVMVVLSIISMTIGNLAALVEQDLKRLLAHSTIAHAGYVLIGILSMNDAGYSGAVFYALSLLVMKFAAFLVVVQVAGDGRNLRIEQLAGLHRRSPVLALTLMISAFSLAGIPPTIGFTGKFLVFAAAMQRGYFTLVLIAMINVVISLYYYLLVIRAAYLLEPREEPADVRISPALKSLSIAMTCLMVVGGIFPHYLIELARAAVRGLM